LLLVKGNSLSRAAVAAVILFFSLMGISVQGMLLTGNANKVNLKKIEINAELDSSAPIQELNAKKMERIEAIKQGQRLNYKVKGENWGKKADFIEEEILFSENKIIIEKEDAAVLASRGVRNKSAEEIALLEKVVTAEAVGEPYEGKVAVVNVVLNRVESELYPNTITEVLLQESQFTPVKTAKINKVEPTEEVKKAVSEALAGRCVVGKDVLYFLNPDTATCTIIPQTKEFVTRIGNHYFYR
jgi:spore germination cell wall hydrolase CwlJ-like protein